jgi:dTDP-4-dehydrorhamnose reductase
MLPVMKIMITGGKGQLGSDCTQVLQKSHDVMSVDIEEIDIALYSDLAIMVQGFLPDVIVNCAAYTQVDSCETAKDLAWEVNVKGAENLALCAQKYGCRLVHISTDYVFDGLKNVPEPYIEDDNPNPLSYYGVTKFESEKAVRRRLDQHVIIRTSWLYGLNGQNFLKTMLKTALKNPDKTIKVVSDQFGSPTWSWRLALQIAGLIDKNGQGTYHATAEGYCSWYELASYFFKKMAVTHNLIPCSSEEYPTPAARPKNSILENRYLKQKNMNIMKNWQDDLDQFVTSFRKHLIQECQPK